MYYQRDGVRQVTGDAALRKFLAAFFAVCCIGGSLGGGNMFQANQATAQIVGHRWRQQLLRGPELAGRPGLRGRSRRSDHRGIKSIAKVTEKIVPLMAGIYLAACLIVILGSLSEVPGAMGDIISAKSILTRTHEAADHARGTAVPFLGNVAGCAAAGAGKDRLRAVANRRPTLKADGPGLPQSGPTSPDDGLRSVGHLQLGEDARDVVADRLGAQAEVPGYCRVVQPPGNQVQHLPLPVR